jgi:hypothetical protein
MNTKSITIDIAIRRNGKTKNTVLNGFAFVESGFLSGKILPSEEITDEEQILTTAFSFTGCPIAARVENPDLNPWLLTNGSYQNERTLHSPEFNVKAKLKSVGIGDKIHMTLDLDVDGEIENLVSIRKPFQESIYQVSKGNLEGKFQIEFNTKNGKGLKANAISKYHLAIEKDILPVWRNIVILNSGSKDNFTQTEQIDLFGDKEIADKDLQSKSKVAQVQS